MSSALAIAAVTAVLKDQLVNGLKAFKIADIVGGDVTVSALAPDRIDLTGDEDPNQLNIFLYKTTYNPGWRNIGLPVRNGNGDRVDDNPLALNLHYLLSAYGAKDFYPEIILGSAMQLLHESPVLTRNAIRKALNPLPVPAGWPTALVTSELAEQVEQLKISPESFSMDQTWSLWSAVQGRYRPTAAYQVTVVLIESTRPTKKALPVAGRNAYIVPFDQPVIDSVENEAGEGVPIIATSKLLVKGRGLRGEITRVLMGGVDLTANVTELRETQIKITLPAPLPSGIRAGIQTMQVEQLRAMGTPPVPHAGDESNVEAFILRPIITTNAPTDVTNAVVDGVNVRSGKVKIDFDPKVGKTQRVLLLLNQLDPPAGQAPRAYTFRAPRGNGVVDPDTETASVTISFTNVVPSDYLVRLQVDGAESLLVVDGTGKYATPKVTI